MWFLGWGTKENPQSRSNDKFKLREAKCRSFLRQCWVSLFLQSRAFGDIAMIVGPIVGGMLFIAVVGAVVFLIMARRRRRSEGKYKPATQEQTSPRLQLDNMIKPPPEERLI